MPRVVGIVALFVLLTACDTTNVKTVASPSPIIAQGNWDQALAFKGDVNGSMTGIVPDNPPQNSECTGSRTHNGETWSDTFYGTLDSSGAVWGVVFLVDNFRGPGTYLNQDVTVEMHTPDTTRVWSSADGGKVTFLVARNQQSGTVDASLTNAQTGKAGAEHITGSWNCRG
jgi:hypothetical protein